MHRSAQHDKCIYRAFIAIPNESWNLTLPVAGELSEDSRDSPGSETKFGPCATLKDGMAASTVVRASR